MEAVEIKKANRSSNTQSLEFVKDKDILTTYFKEIKGTPTLSGDAEKILAQKIKEGDKYAFNTLVEANLKFVVAVCRKYQHQGLPMTDLINEGNLGLITAAQRFDASFGCKFITYAVWWIRQGILTALAEQGSTLNLSTSYVSSIQEIDACTHRLEQSLGRKSTLEEIAHETGRSVKHISEFLQMRTHTISLSASDHGDQTSSLEEILTDLEEPGADKAALQFLLGEKVRSLVEILEPKEKMVIKLYFGIGRESRKTLVEISEHLNLTRERIRQIKEKALEKLRQPSKLRRLKAFRS